MPNHFWVVAARGDLRREAPELEHDTQFVPILFHPNYCMLCAVCVSSHTRNAKHSLVLHGCRCKAYAAPCEMPVCPFYVISAMQRVLTVRTRLWGCSERNAPTTNRAVSIWTKEEHKETSAKSATRWWWDWGSWCCCCCYYCYCCFHTEDQRLIPVPCECNVRQVKIC